MYSQLYEKSTYILIVSLSPHHRKKNGVWAGEFTIFLVQWVAALQLLTTALFVRVFYQSASTVRCGIN